MASKTGQFTAAQQSSGVLLLRKGSNATLDSIFAGAAAFAFVLEEVLSGGIAFRTIATYAADQTALAIRNDSGRDLYLRLRCTTLTATETIDYTLADAASDEILHQFADSDGNVVMSITDTGVVITGTASVSGAATLSSTVAVGDALNTAQGADKASAATLNLSTATGNIVDVTGTTTITAITLAQGRTRTVRFTGILTLTHGASLVLPNAANITTAAGDYAIFAGYGSGVVRCVAYFKLSGQPVVAPTRANLGVDVAAIAVGIPVTALRHTTGVPLTAAETAGGFNCSVAAHVMLAQGEVTDNETEVSVCHAQVVLPPEYKAGGTVTVRLPVAIVKTGSATDNGSTVDVAVYKQAAGAVGADLSTTTAAATFAALDTWYDKDFVITPTGLVAGDALNIEITSSIIDNEAGAGTLRLNMGAPRVLLDLQG